MWHESDFQIDKLLQFDSFVFFFFFFYFIVLAK